MSGTGKWLMIEVPAKSLWFSHRRHKPETLVLTTFTFHVVLRSLSLFGCFVLVSALSLPLHT